MKVIFVTDTDFNGDVIDIFSSYQSPSSLEKIKLSFIYILSKD